MHNYWSVQLTCEAALQVVTHSNFVKWLDISPVNKRKYQINSQDFVNRIIRKDNLSQLSYIFSPHNIDFDINKIRIIRKIDVENIVDIDQLLDIYYKSHPIGSIVFSGISSKLKSTNFTFYRFRNLIQDYLDYCVSVVELLEREVATFKPTNIFTVNDRIMGSALAVSVGKKYNIKNTVFYWGSNESLILGYDDSLYNIEQWHEKIQEKFVNNPPNDDEKSLILSKIENLGLEASETSIQYTKYQKKGKGIDVAKDKKLCVFYANSTYEHSPLLFIKLKNGFKGQYEAFDALQHVCQKYQYTLILKHHPTKRKIFRRRSKVIHNWEKFNVKEETIELKPDTDVDTYELIKQADINVTWGSTVGLESLAIGKPTLILGNLAWLNKKWNVHAWDQQEIENFFSKKASTIDKDEFVLWFWYLNKFGYPCKFTKLENKSVQILNQTIFKQRFIFLVLYKMMIVILEKFKNNTKK